MADSLAARPMLCDLISAQAAVLERNVSPRVAAQYKRASIAGISALGAFCCGPCPNSASRTRSGWPARPS